MMEMHKNAQRKLFVLLRNRLFLPTKSYNKCKRHPFFFFFLQHILALDANEEKTKIKENTFKSFF